MGKKYTLYVLGLTGLLFGFTGVLIKIYFSLFILGNILFGFGFIIVVIYIVIFIYKF